MSMQSGGTLQGVSALQGVSTLQGVPFTDLILSPDTAWVKLKPVSSSGGLQDATGGMTPVTSDLQEDVDAIRNMIAAIRPVRYFTIRYEDMVFRGSHRETVDGEWHFLRRAVQGELPSLDQLGYHPMHVEALMNPKFVRGGLLLIGEPGSGKTTTASAWISARLRAYGGLAITLENPPELPLHGKHGQGMCVQVPVDDGDYAQACAQVLRDGAANIVMLGEILEPDTAIQYLRTGLIGKIAVSTVHGPNLSLGLERLADMVTSTSYGDRKGAFSLLADSLALVVHQRLEPKSDGGSRLRAEMMVMTPEAKSMVRGENLAGLVNEVKKQAAMVRFGSNTA
ncbi:ATPase, T2SS/T4P/T4SS family [Acidithiobacillus sp.]